MYLKIILLIYVKFGHAMNFSEYFSTLKTMEHNKNSIAIVNSHLAQDYLKFLKGVSIEIFNFDGFRNEFSLKYTTKYEYAIIFIEKFGEITRITQKFLQEPSIWYSNIHYNFIVLNDTIKSKNLDIHLKLLWNTYRIYHFHLAMYNSTLNDLHVFTYDVFKDILNDFHSSKSIDMNGKAIKGNVIIVDPTEGEFNNNICVWGSVCIALNAFLKKLNATFKSIETEDTAGIYKFSKQIVVDGFSDISVGRHWLTTEHLMYASYSIEVSTVVGIVHNAKLRSVLANLYYMFDIYVWSLTAIFKSLFACLQYIGVKKAIFVNANILSIVTETAFQSAIITALTSPKYEKNINTVEDLCVKGYTARGEDDWVFMLNEKLKFEYLSYVEVGDKLWRFKLGSKEVYLSTDYWAEQLLMNRSNSDIFYSSYYHIIKEPLGMGHLTYYLKRNFQLTQYFNRILLLMHDHGLNSKFAFRKYSFKKDRKVQKLNLSHVYSAFLPLVCGLCLSTLAFIIELACQSKKINKSY